MKTNYEIAIEVIGGKWGNNEIREKKLTEAGYNYDAVQKCVNEIVALHLAISDAAKAQVAWSKDSIYKWEQKPNIVKSKTHGTCVTFVACVLHRIGVLSPGNYVWTNGKGFGDGKIYGLNSRMTVTYYNNKKTVGDLKLQVGDILIFDDNKSGRAGDGGHICIVNGKKYASGIHTFTGGHTISVNGKERFSRKVLAVVRIKNMPKRKTVDELAHEVLDGKWSSGVKREESLINAGYDYVAVQKRVNEILNPPRPTPSGYKGTLPSYRLKKTNEEVIADAITWAKWIAKDNRFHYGYGTHAHHNGCYFCGTQRLKKNRKPAILDPDFTYCCNPFVGAAWAHGGGDATAYRLCHNTNSWDFSVGQGYDTSKLFDKLGRPDYSKLKPGDVLCKQGGHVALYIGNKKVVHASGGDDNVRNSTKWNNSIRTGTWNGWERAYRYNGKVDCDRPLSHGEVSTRVKHLQEFLTWYGITLDADRIFGDKTLAAVKQFQKEQKLTVDGWVGPATIKKMSEIVK